MFVTDTHRFEENRMQIHHRHGDGTLDVYVRPGALGRIDEVVKGRYYG